MYQFTVNGKKYETNEDKNLMSFLRDDLGLFSVKNGCSEGFCGTCSVLIDGKLMKACVQKTSRMDGKTINTLEGFSSEEKHIYAYAYSKMGAVQCGFCIPGMIIATKALLDVNSNPTREECANAIKGNICRCTGYVKIIDAMMYIAELLRMDKKDLPEAVFESGLGNCAIKVDAMDKALGKPMYVDDMRFPNMAFARAKRTEHPRARILSIDKQEAEKMDGVIKVIVAEDVPGLIKCGHLVKDWPAIIKVGEVTRYIGDTLAIVVAENEEVMHKAVASIKVEYEVLEPICDPIKALEENSPKVHEDRQEGNLLSFQKLNRGNTEEALKNSKHIVNYTFSTPFTEHAFLEPECAIATPTEDGVEVITSDQGIYDDQREIASLLGIKNEQVRIKAAYVGGGFGGKEDMSVQHHAALCAFLTKRIVKVKLSRQESLHIHPKRHPMIMDFTLGCDEKGKLTGLKARIVSDTGAYASLGGPVLQRACTHAAGPYNYQNVDIEGRAAYTNNVPGGAFRGFGVTQSIFALECCLNKLAEKAGLDEYEIRELNAIKPGDELPNGQIADDSTAYLECLHAIKDEYYKYKNDPHHYVGIASALKNAGLGVGIPDTGRCEAEVIDGKVHLKSSAADIGQGIHTVMMQIFTQATGLKFEDIVVEKPDTGRTPNSGTTTASRQTVFTGEATRRAAIEFKKALYKVNGDFKKLTNEKFFGEYVSVTDPMGSEKKNPVSHVAYGYAAQIVVLDKDGKVKKVVSAHDMGRAMNIKGVEGQIEGGTVMGLGYGLTEDYKIENSMPKVKYGKIGLLRANQIPEIKSILVQKNENELAYGAKVIGEIVVIPSAPACQNAYYHKDGEFRLTLPLQHTFYKK